MIAIRPARAEEADALTDICVRSKAYWGYDETFMNACHAELVVTRANIENSRFMVAELKGVPVAVSEIVLDQGVANLERLFVDAPAIGKGAGRALYDDAVFWARSNGAKRLRIEADPFAESFYHARGAVTIGDVASGTVPGRRIPLLIQALDSAIG